MKISDLKKGMTVTYIPRRLKNQHPPIYKEMEVGIVTSWNDTYVFVDYGTGHSKATMIEDLSKGDQSFYCSDEHNSVLDGAFGRCQQSCGRC